MKNVQLFFICVILILAFRVGYIKYTPSESLVQADSYVYMALADNIIEGKGMHTGKYFSIRPPAYPIFLAAVFKIFGKNIFAVQLVQILLSLLAAWFLYKISDYYFGSKIAGITLFFYAISYTVFSLPGQILSEGLYLTVLLAAVCLLLQKQLFLSGFFFGLTYLVRQEVLVFVLALIVIEFFCMRGKPCLLSVKDSDGISFRSKIKQVLRFIIPVVLCVSFWGIRNYRIHGKFIIGSTYTYRHLYAGNEYIFQRLGWEPQQVDIDNIPGDLSEVEEEKFRKKWFFNMLKQQPVYRLIAAPFLKLAFFLYPFLPQYDLTYMWILPFWLMGMFLLRKKMLDYIPLYAVFTVLAALIGLLHAVPRYRSVFYPFMLIFASYSLYDIWARRGRYKIYVFLWFALNILIYVFDKQVRALIKGLI